jgi:D-3-phosphoglycerate dehydrogenase
VKTYADKIRIQLNKKGHYDDFSATLFGENDFRIVKIDGHAIEVLLDGGMMLYKNIDKPGMLAAVSSTLAKRDINIAALSLGRTGTQAVTAVMVDTELSADVLNEVDALPGVDQVVFVQIHA